MQKDLQIHIYNDFRSAEKAWRYLEENGLYTAYQRYDWLEAWHRNIGAKEGIEPFLITLYEGDKPVSLLSLAKETKYTKSLVFMGGKHNNYNMPLFMTEYEEAIRGCFKNHFISCLKTHAADINLVSLQNQPFSWEGYDNPLKILPNQPSPSFSFKLALREDFDALASDIRGNNSLRKLRRKERRLSENDDFKVKSVETEEEVEKVFQAFLKQKRERFKELGIENIFDEPNTLNFFHEVALKSVKEAPGLFLFHYLESHGEIRATYGGGLAKGRYSCSVNSISTDDLTRYSPADVLLLHVIEDLCNRGFATFDLGIGEASYKDAWCEPDPLFDIVTGLTAKGKAIVSVKKNYLALKRSIKQTPALWNLYLKLRKLKNGK
jgi:CelD/BcsL family acetyltransferase involved in cellulose biosynthesis